MPLDDDLRTLAETQYALVAVEQFRALGGTPAARRHRLAGSDWEAATDRVLRLVGAPHSIRQRLMVAVLHGGPGTAISHTSAAALWRLPGFGFGFGAVEVSRHRSRPQRPTALATLHRPRLLPVEHVTELHGIPVTSLGRTLFDLAANLHPMRLERIVETVVSKSPSALRSLHSLLEELGGSGRSGVTSMRTVLSTRPHGYQATASGLEARFARMLDNAGEAPLERQVDLGGHEWVGRVDFLDRQHGIVFEIDSDIHHTSRMDRARDHLRDQALLAAGWRAVVRIVEDDVWRRPDRAVAAVIDARTSARLALAAESGTLALDSAARRP